MHSSDVKQLFYSERLGKLVSCSLDGTLQLTDLKAKTSDQLMKGDPLVGCVAAEPGIVAACQDGTIVLFGYDDSVLQLKVKCKARPSALYSTNTMLFVGDWDGNMYQYHYASQESRSYRFSDFSYEGRVVPNGIYAICLDASGSIFVGLSSGHIAVGKKGQFRLFHVHDKPVRGLRSVSQPGCCVSCGNDGHVLLFDSTKRTSLELQSVYMDREYIFGIDVSPDKNFVVYAGTGAVAECVDLRTSKTVW